MKTDNLNSSKPNIYDVGEGIETHLQNMYIC